MSLPEPTEILSKIDQFQAEITNEQNIFDEANRSRKLLQEDIEKKQIELKSLKEHWQEQDNDALKSLAKLWQQQKGIKRQLSDWSENGIKKAIEEQTAKLKTQLNEIESKYEDISSEISEREKFNLFLQGNIDLMDQDTIAAFSQLVGEDDKQELLKENSQDIADLNAMITDLEKEHESLTKQEQKLKGYSLADNLAYDIGLQKLFEERQTDITKKIDNIVSQQDDSELKKQYENVKLQEEEIKLIQNQIEENNQIIKQTKQKEEELFAKLEQLQQESSIPQFSSKQEREEIVNQYPILQERANDIAASIERQIELNKLNDLIKQQGEEIDIEKDRADSLAQQLKKLTLSTNKEIEGNLIVIKELQENIKRLEKKERQFIIPQGSSWADELKEGGEPSEFVQLEDQIGELTKKNDDLKANLEALGVLSAEKDEKLKVAEEGYKKELSKQSEQITAGVVELQEASKKLLQLETQLTSERQKRQEELEGKQKTVKELQESLLVESNQSKELQAKLGELATDNSKLQNEINVAEERHNKELNRQSQQVEVKLQEASDKLLQLETQLTSEQQKRQEELEGKQKTVKELQESLLVESNQSKELQAKLGELATDNSKLQNEINVAEERHNKELNRQSQQVEVKLQEASDKLLQLETQLTSEQQKRQEELEGKQKTVKELQESLLVESNQSKELQAKLGELATDNSKLQNEINVAEERHNKELNRQSQQVEVKLQEASEKLLQLETQLRLEQQGRKEELEKQQKIVEELKKSLSTEQQKFAEKGEELNAAEEGYKKKLSEQLQQAEAKLQEVNNKLLNLETQLKSQQQEKQKELGESQQIVKELQKSLSVEQQKFIEKSNQTKNLQTQVGELTNAQQQFATKLEEAKNQLEALSANKDLEYNKLNAEKEKHKEELNRQLAELQAAKEELSNLQTQLRLEQQGRKEELEKQQKIVEELKKSLSTEQQKFAEKGEELNAAEEGYKKKLSEQLQQAEAKLQEVNNKLLNLETQLKSQQQEKQKDLGESQQIVKELQKSLSVEQQKFVEKSNQAENLQTQVGELTNAQQQFATKLEEAKNQLKALSANKDLEYNKLNAEKDSLKNELDKQSKVAAEQAQENQKNASRITELESQNAALLAQLASLNVKVETSAVGIQTDEVLSNTMKSVGTGTEPVMGSGVSTKEAMTNTTEVIIQQQTVSPLIERQTIDRVLVHDNDDDKILWAFKKLSREQVQPIIDKCGLESGSNFAKFAQEDFKKLSEVFQDTQILRDIENIEQKSYADIHKEFASEYKDIIWQGKDAEKSFSLQQNGNDVAIISEKKLSYDNDVKYKTSDGESIKNVRTVNILLSMDIKGSCHMSFAVQDTNGRNISKENAVYLTAHYNNGKLVHLTKPTEIFACSDDTNSPLYLKRDGKIYTLPVNKYALGQLEQEVLKNKGEYVGIVKNASGDIISINSGSSQEGRSERLCPKNCVNFKIGYI